MISAGLLKEKIDIYTPVKTESKYGGIIDGWECVKERLQARVQFQRGSMIMRQGDIMMSQIIAITIRESKRWNEQQRIRWQGKMYRIESFNSADGDTTITASRIEDGEQEKD